MTHNPAKKALNRRAMKNTKGGLNVGTDVPGGPDITPPPTLDAEVVSPRDPASGLPTGKRMHKPFLP